MHKDISVQQALFDEVSRLIHVLCDAKPGVVLSKYLVVGKERGVVE